jgi:galactose-1-phosphate uridylyltransferase
MPEFRQDIITGNWVIVAKERARRPEDFSEPLRANDQ